MIELVTIDLVHITLSFPIYDINYTFMTALLGILAPYYAAMCSTDGTSILLRLWHSSGAQEDGNFNLRNVFA